MWAARFFKTRSLAQQAIAAGRVKLNDARIKPAHEVKVGDRVALRKEELEWHLQVLVLSDKRGPAEAARKLYEETPAIEKGQLVLPEKHGLGLKFDEKVIEKYRA